MSDSHDVMNDPTNRIVAVLDNSDAADAARSELTDYGIDEARIKTFEGSHDADSIDTSAKWFADTDVDMQRIQEQLLLGNAVLSVPVDGKEVSEAVHKILKRHNATHITHFGKWVTEVLR